MPGIKGKNNGPDGDFSFEKMRKYSLTESLFHYGKTSVYNITSIYDLNEILSGH